MAALENCTRLVSTRLFLRSTCPNFATFLPSTTGKAEIYEKRNYYLKSDCNGRHDITASDTFPGLPSTGLLYIRHLKPGY